MQSESRAPSRVADLRCRIAELCAGAPGRGATMYSRKRDPCRTFDAWMRWFEIDDAQADGRDAGSGEGLCVLRSGRPRST
jgi:hypothetical protein